MAKQATKSPVIRRLEDDDAPAQKPAAKKEPTKTGSVTYKPQPGDPDVTVAFGRTFTAGKAVAVDDPKVFEKLSGNPSFGFAEAADDPHAKDLAKKQEAASEEARKKREEANEASAEAEAAERARQALISLNDAKNDPDRDPPVTNHAVNR